MSSPRPDLTDYWQQVHRIAQRFGIPPSGLWVVYYGREVLGHLQFIDHPCLVQVTTNGTAHRLQVQVKFPHTQVTIIVSVDTDSAELYGNVYAYAGRFVHNVRWQPGEPLPDVLLHILLERLAEDRGHVTLDEPDR